MQAGRDTIVAVSSPPGRSARGLVRLSGPDAVAVARVLLKEGAGDPPPNRLIRGRLSDPPIACLLAFFPAARSYTGDDTLELQLPGNPALLERVLRACLARGARLAEPGEFTFRAFLSGRIDLTQAEGIAATIAAESRGQLRAASMLRRGKLGSFAGSLVERLGTLLALVEAGIDFTDQEDVLPIAPADLAAGVEACHAELASLLSRARSWGGIEALPRVVLVGPPSSGKSTLFNALLGRKRAVVHALPGTTRDVLEEPLTLQLSDVPGGPVVEVMLVDVAGLDAPAAMLDAEAQAAARRAIDAADLVLAIIDPLRPPAPAPAGALRVATKADLGRADADVAVSAVSGEGLEALRAAVAARVGARGVPLAGEALALQPRHEAALREAGRRLGDAAALLAPQRGAGSLDGVELVAGRLREALDALASLGGRLTPDDIIGRVFATFCVGK